MEAHMRIFWLWLLAFGLVCLYNICFFIYVRIVAQSESVREEGVCRMTFVTTSSEEENRGFMQTGYMNSFTGKLAKYSWWAYIWCAWIQMGVMTLDQYQLVKIWTEPSMGWKDASIPILQLGFLSLSLMLAFALLGDSLEVWFMVPVPLSKATDVLVSEEEDGIGGQKRMCSQLVKVEQTYCAPHVIRHIEYTCIRYLWDENDCRFKSYKPCLQSGSAIQENFNTGGLSIDMAERTAVVAGPNLVTVTVPTVVEALTKEFLGQPISIFQSSCIWMFVWYTTWNLAFLWMILVVAAGVNKAIFVDRKNQSEVAKMAALSQDVDVFRQGAWMVCASADLVPGDIYMPREGMSLPADSILVHGTLVMQESMLTGEPMPIQKFPVENTSVPLSLEHDKKHFAYAGTHVMQSTGPSDGRAVCQIFTTGGLTAKGQLVRMVLFPNPLQFKFEKSLNYTFMFMCAYCAALFLGLTFGQADAFDADTPIDSTKNMWVVTVWSGLCILAEGISPNLPVAIVSAQSGYCGGLKSKKIDCLQPARIPIAGKLTCFVFDKTGTITHDGMDIVSVLPVDNGVFQKDESVTKGISHLPTMIQYAMGSCHTVTTLQCEGSENQLVGNAVEISMVKASGWSLPLDDGHRITAPALDSITHLDVVRQLAFDHHRMTSGCVVRTPEGKVFAMVKGSYEKIGKLASGDSVPKNYREVTEQLAAEQFYILGLGAKELAADADVVNMSREELEAGLTLVGLLNFRNEMKEDSPAVFEELRAAGIRSIMCTGDNAITGCAIAKRANLLPTGTKGIQIIIGDMEKNMIVWRDFDTKATVKHDLVMQCDYRTTEICLTAPVFRQLIQTDEIKHIMPAIRVAARMKPDDKVNTIKLLQERGLIVGMCGDGGNDCGALRASHVGVALSDSDASLVAPFSTTRKSLYTVTDVVKAGRACMVTNVNTTCWYVCFGLFFPSTKLYLILRDNYMFAEWNYVFLCMFQAMLMVGFMVRCEPLKQLASTRPTSSMASKTTILNIIVPSLIFALTLIYVLFDLESQPNFISINLVDYEIDPQNWTFRADNFVTPTVFLVAAWQMTNLAVCYSFGFKHRKPIYSNKLLCLCIAASYGFLAFLLWSKPNAISAIFRINTDVSSSLRTDIPGIKQFSVGPVGDCFYGSQMKFDKEDTERLGLTFYPPSSKMDAPNQCATGSPLNSNGNQFTHIYDHSPEGCHGLNNCFTDDFKMTTSLAMMMMTLLTTTSYYFMNCSNKNSKKWFDRL